MQLEVPIPHVERGEPHPDLLPQGEGERIERYGQSLNGELFPAPQNTTLSQRKRAGVRGKSIPIESFRLSLSVVPQSSLAGCRFFFEARVLLTSAATEFLKPLQLEGLLGTKGQTLSLFAPFCGQLLASIGVRSRLKGNSSSTANGP